VETEVVVWSYPQAVLEQRSKAPLNFAFASASFRHAQPAGQTVEGVAGTVVACSRFLKQYFGVATLVAVDELALLALCTYPQTVSEQRRYDPPNFAFASDSAMQSHPCPQLPATGV
jgi:hypothetical protein